MIRVGSLCDMAAVDKEHIDSKSGHDRQGAAASASTRRLSRSMQRRDAAFSDVDSRLSAIGLRRLTMNSLAPDEQKYIKRYFKDVIAPVLSPQIVDSHHPFPHLEGKVLHIAALLSHKKTERLGLLPVPASLPAGCVPARRHRRAIFSPRIFCSPTLTMCSKCTTYWKRPCSALPATRIFRSGRRDLRRGRRRFPQKDGKAAAAAPPHGCRARGDQPSHQRPLQRALPQPL